MTGFQKGYCQNPSGGDSIIIIKGIIDDPIGEGEGHKSPEVGLPTVWFNSSSSILTFEGTSDLDYTPIYIYDDEDEVVYIDSLLFDIDGFCEFNLSALPIGDYVLVFELNGREYEGDFSK
jgi:hypothetical protein